MASLLACNGPAGDTIIEPGPAEISAGSSSSDIRSSATLTLTGQPRIVTGTDRALLAVGTVG